MNDSTYVSVSRLRVDLDRVEELIAAFRSRAGQVDSFAGFLGLEVWRSDRTPGEVLMVSHWRDRADFTTYMKSEQHQLSHDRVPADLRAAVHLEELQHQAGYEVVAR